MQSITPGSRVKRVFRLFSSVSPYAARWGGREGDCPVAESVCDRIVRLPFYNDLSETDQNRVIEALLDYPG